MPTFQSIARQNGRHYEAMKTALRISGVDYRSKLSGLVASSSSLGQQRIALAHLVINERVNIRRRVAAVIGRHAPRHE